jgi:voltage-gated potassium channel Kch
VITANVKKLNEQVKIIARSHIPVEEEALKTRGISVTVEPEFEAAIAISKRLLTYYGKTGIDVGNYLKRSRRRQLSRLKSKLQIEQKDQNMPFSQSRSK